MTTLNRPFAKVTEVRDAIRHIDRQRALTERHLAEIRAKLPSAAYSAIQPDPAAQERLNELRRDERTLSDRLAESDLARAGALRELEDARAAEAAVVLAQRKEAALVLARRRLAAAEALDKALAEAEAAYTSLRDAAVELEDLSDVTGVAHLQMQMDIRFAFALTQAAPMLAVACGARYAHPGMRLGESERQLWDRLLTNS